MRNAITIALVVFALIALVGAGTMVLTSGTAVGVNAVALGYAPAQGPASLCSFGPTCGWHPGGP